jgi:C-5 cytosine-specific DNA methylase
VNVVDLFCGRKGWSRAFAERGHSVWTVDIEQRFEPDFWYDIRDLKPEHIPFDHVDILLASPPCEGFSVTTMGKSWGGGEKIKIGPRMFAPAYQPMTETARLGMELVAATVVLIEEVQPTYAVVENPRGALRKLDLLPHEWERVTVWYCHYQERNAKPTDLWGAPFPLSWRPEPPCVKGARGCGQAIGTNELCHDLAPRGSPTGTQGRDGYSDRARVPYALSMAMCEAAERDLAEVMV